MEGINMIGLPLGVNLKTVPEHYGVKEADFEKKCKEMLSDMILMEDFGKVLDKHFKKCDAETRVFVHAYSEAIFKMRQLLGV